VLETRLSSSRDFKKAESSKEKTRASRDVSQGVGGRLRRCSVFSICDLETIRKKRGIKGEKESLSVFLPEEGRV